MFLKASVKIFKSWYKKNPKQALTIIGVIGCHLLLLCAGFISSFSLKKNTPKPILVNTITLPPPQKTEKNKETAPKKVTKAKKIEKKKEKEKPKTKSNPKPKSKPKIVKKKTAKKQPISSKLLKELEDSLDKIEKTPKNTKVHNPNDNNIKPLPTLQSLEMDAFETPHQANYLQNVVFYLKNYLSFPEVGEVNIKLTIGKFGNVVSVKVLQSESKKNEQYITETLPSISFPNFSREYPDEKIKDFVIHLKNLLFFHRDIPLKN